MSELRETFKELRNAVENDGSWNGENFVRMESEEANIDRLFDEVERLIDAIKKP